MPEYMTDIDPTAEPSALLPPSYQLRASPPTADDFCRLRRSAGMSERSLEAAERGLPNTLFGVHVVETDTEAAVGMARVVGDGGANFHLVDAAVAECHQGQGIGTAMVDAVVRWIRPTAPDGAYVDLLADVDGFYEQWGFERTAPASNAMGVRSETLQPIRPRDE